MNQIKAGCIENLTHVSYARLGNGYPPGLMPKRMGDENQWTEAFPVFSIEHRMINAIFFHFGREIPHSLLKWLNPDKLSMYRSHGVPLREPRTLTVATKAALRGDLHETRTYVLTNIIRGSASGRDRARTHAVLRESVPNVTIIPLQDSAHTELYLLPEVLLAESTQNFLAQLKKEIYKTLPYLQAYYVPLTRLVAGSGPM